jgi:hypothetical protein
MDLNKSYIQKKIYLKKPLRFAEIINNVSRNSLFESTNLNFVNPVRENDYYIDVLLTKTSEVFEYVDIKKDERIFKIERQLVNPYFINYDFFSSVKRISVNNGSDLDDEMVKYLRVNYAFEEIIDDYRIAAVAKLTPAFVNANPNHIWKDCMAIIIHPDDREIVLPITDKFRLTGSTYFDGIFIYDKQTGVWRDPTYYTYVTFICKPNKPWPAGINLVTEGDWDYYIFPDPNSTKVQIIKDRLNNTIYDAYFNNPNWDIVNWFNMTGYHKLSTIKDEENNDTELDKLEKLRVDTKSVVSKSYFFPISINK